MQNNQAIYKITLAALLGAFVFITKVLLSFLPNIEVVTFLLTFFALVLPLGTSCWIVFVYSFLQFLAYGFCLPLWIVYYLFILIVFYNKKTLLRNPVLFISLNALFGFAFGLIFQILFIIFNIFILGSAYYGFWNVIWSGIWFDLVHGVGNFTVAYFLFAPVLKLWNNYLYHAYLNSAYWKQTETQKK